MKEKFILLEGYYAKPYWFWGSFLHCASVTAASWSFVNSNKAYQPDLVIFGTRVYLNRATGNHTVHFSSFWVTAMPNGQLRLCADPIPQPRGDTSRVTVPWNSVKFSAWSSGYILWNQHCLQSSAPRAQRGAELCLYLCVSPRILKSPETLLVRCTFVFSLVKMSAYYIYFSLGLYRNLKSTKYSSEFEPFFFIAVSVIII